MQSHCQTVKQPPPTPAGLHDSKRSLLLTHLLHFKCETKPRLHFKILSKQRTTRQRCTPQKRKSVQIQQANTLPASFFLHIYSAAYAMPFRNADRTRANQSPSTRMRAATMIVPTAFMWSIAKAQARHRRLSLAANMMFEFHGSVKTERAVAVACSALVEPSRCAADLTVVVWALADMGPGDGQIFKLAASVLPHPRAHSPPYD